MRMEIDLEHSHLLIAQFAERATPLGSVVERASHSAGAAGVIAALVKQAGTSAISAAPAVSGRAPDLVAALTAAGISAARHSGVFASPAPAPGLASAAIAAGANWAKIAACSLADAAGGCTSSAARPASFSGSPMVNAKGEIVGLVFDGNIHSISGSYWFDAEKNRTVAVHPAFIRAALEQVYDAPVLRELEAVGVGSRAAGR